LVLWLFVRGEPGTERVITVPLEAQIPPHMEITNERTTSVEVTLRGPATSSFWFGQSVPTCIVNIQGAEEGEHTIPLTPDNVRIPRASGIEVLKVNPARVTLRLERTISKEVPIVVPIREEPARDFEVYGKSSNPASVVITGPRSHVEPIDEIPTEAVSVGERHEALRGFVSLNISDNTIRSSVTTPVEVAVSIGPRRRVHTIRNVPVVAGSDYTAVPKEVSVRLMVPSNFDGQLTASDLSAGVDTTNLDDSRLPARLKVAVKFTRDLGSGTMIRDIQPQEVTVSISGGKPPTAAIR